MLAFCSTFCYNRGMISDPAMLLSVVNCALRDGKTLGELAEELSSTEEEIVSRLADAGYVLVGGSYPQFKCE